MEGEKLKMKGERIMKQIVKPVVPAKTYDQTIGESGEDKKQITELESIQKNRSLLPKSSEQPVHKCGCT